MKKLTFITIMFFFAVLMIIGITAYSQTTILSEDFEGGTLPAGWSNLTNSAPGWQFGTASTLSSGYFEIPDHTKIACTNDDADGSTEDGQDTLITPQLDLTSYSNVFLTFDLFYYDKTYGGSTENLTIEASTDGGSSWSLVKDLDGDNDWYTVYVDISDFAGYSNVLIAFNYDDGGGWLYGAAIDNVEIYEPLQWDASMNQITTQQYLVLGNYNVTGTIKNYGGNTITSIDINWQLDTGTIYTQNLTGLNIAPTATYDFTHQDQLNLTAIGSYNLKVWTSNPNGNADMNTANDTLITIINALDQVSQRFVLIEHFTNASCAPCASQNPALNTLIENNLTKVAHIAYHTSWPGTDPMYNYNQSIGQGNARVSYYDVSGVPDVEFAGNQLNNAAPGDITQQMINNEYARPGLFDITGNAIVNGSNLNISVTIEALANFPTGTIKVHVVLVEDLVYATPPGSNGETEFHNAMRKMFPNTSGTNIGHPSSHDDTTLTFSYTIPSQVTIANCQIVVFVQNDVDKEVYMVDYLDNNFGINENESAFTYFEIYPNPFANEANIEFYMNQPKEIRLTVYNQIGELVYSENMQYNSGKYKLKLNAENWASGLYSINLTTENETFSKKAVLNR